MKYKGIVKKHSNSVLHKNVDISDVNGNESN